jgi:hypothetical protein
MAGARLAQPVTLYSYIVKHDNGFSPNPFFGYCTLACCKPEIRRRAEAGDWIIGLAPKAQGNKIVYFMRVDEIIGFEHYWSDRRFRQKRPQYDRGTRHRCGDNIYEPIPNGDFRQLQSLHSHGQNEHAKNKEHDLGGKRVLISETFAYFGSKALALPLELSALRVGRGHKCRFSDEVKTEFLQLVSRSGLGIHASPRHWPSGDETWKIAACDNR